MRAIATAFALVATSAVAAPPATPGQGSAEAGASTAPASTATPSPTEATTSTPAPAPRKLGADTPTQAVVDKLGLGDRLLLSGDKRGALFAYQDAVYAQPTYAPARVRLGRAYLALRYPDQAIAQAEAALAEDPDNGEARKLLEDARAAPPRQKPGAPGEAPAGAAPAATGAQAGARPPPRVFKLSPEGEGQAAKPPAPTARAAAAGGGAPSANPAPATGTIVGTAAGTAAVAAGATAAVAAAPVAVAAPEPVVAPRGDDPAPAPTSASQKQVAAQHYRTALGFLGSRDWAKAVAVLSDAILADPTLAVAFSARGSAQYGLGKYRDAADDYSAAIRLDPKLATPVYGLAECYRVLGEGKKAADMYERYAQSTASDVRGDLRALAVKRAKELR
jgi:tetratricopeptide (TPR) repeat protein